MDKNLLKKYALLAVNTGVNIQKDDTLVISSPIETAEFARLIAEERKNRAFNIEMGVGAPVSLANLFDNINSDNKELNLIVKGDVQGSIEAIKTSLEKLDVDGVKINIVRCGVGAINENDINLAVASNSIIIAFNVRPVANITDYAKEKNIEIRMYNIIYKVLEDIEKAMTGMLEIGRAHV